MSKYEAHITFDIKYEALVKEQAENSNYKWKFSKILGDPLFGDEKALCYLSRSIDDSYGMYGNVEQTEEGLLTDTLFLCGVLTEKGLKPLRAKVERIEFDKRYNY